MPCLALPAPPAPSLPGGISLAAPLPSFSGSPELCCKIPVFPNVAGPSQLPIGALNALGPLNAVLEQVRGYFDALSIPCPRE